jgi:DNA-binding SARP family transcriptional activator
VRIRVLGPLRVDSGGSVGLAPREADLLALLACAANRAVPVEQLVDALWPDGPPPTAVKSVQVRVHGLRRALGDAGRVRYEYRGYRLVTSPGELDAAEFEALAAQGRSPAGDARILRQALTLWHGAAFAGHGHLEPVRREAVRLDELRRQVVEELAVADLAAGRPTEVVTWLSGWAAESPYRENLQALLMTALHRSGRQAEAQEVYRRTRRLLVEELGVEPGPQLRELYQALLIERPPAAPAELPADPPAFTGRRDEAHRLVKELSGGGVAAVSGQGGIGKSALAIHTAHRLAAGFPDGRLYVNLHGADAGVAPARPSDVLARLLRSLGVLEPPAEVDEAAARFRSLTTGRRILFVLDDAADETQVRPLLPGHGCATLITSRRVLSGLDGAAQLWLGTLTRPESIDLLGGIVGPERLAAEREAAERIADFCGRLPLALRICGARLVAHPERDLTGFAAQLSDAVRRLDLLQHADLAVRAGITVSRRDLESRPFGGAAFRTLQLLALLETSEVTAEVAAALAGQQLNDVRLALDLLVEAQLLEAPGPGRYRLHDLVRLYAREQDLDEDDRLLALRRTFGYYVACGRRASEILDVGQAIWMEPAGDDLPAAPLQSVKEIVDWVDAERADILALVRQAAGLPGEHAAAAIRLVGAVSVLFDVRNYWWEWAALHETAIQVAERLSDPVAQARSHMFLGNALGRLGRSDDELRHVETALALWRQVGDQLGESGALNARGLALLHRSRCEEARRDFEQGLRLRRQVGDLDGEGLLENNLGVALRELGRLDESIGCHRRAAKIYARSASGRLLPHALANLANALRLTGRHVEAVPYFEQSIELHREVGDRHHQAGATWWLGVTLRELGRSGEADGARSAALDLLRQAGRLTAEQVADLMRDPGADPPEAIRLLG